MYNKRCGKIIRNNEVAITITDLYNRTQNLNMNSQFFVSNFYIVTNTLSNQFEY
mgnify:CR=1 FL=1